MTPTETAAKIARKMASLGFVPQPTGGASSHVQYSKTYEQDGVLTHVSVMFLRDPAGRQEARLDGLVVTQQRRLDPIVEVLVKSMPEIARAEALEVATTLGSGVELPTSDYNEQDCKSCGRMSPEYYLVGKSYYCRGCHAKASSTG